MRTVLRLLTGPALLLACGEGPTDAGVSDLSPSRVEDVGTSLAYVAFAAATGSEGHSFLDNFLACPRRGVIHYVNTPSGRAVTFSGCEALHGVTVHGTAALDWTGPGLAPERTEFCAVGATGSCLDRLRLSGELVLSLGDGRSLRLGRVDVAALSVIADAGAFDRRPVAASVTFEGTTVTVDDADGYAQIFAPTGRNVESLSNPSGSFDALTEADMDRLAYHGGLALAGFLLNEVSEVRGDHTHTEPCGTTTVTFDADRMPTAVSDWSACEDRGLFYTGDFTWGFAEFALSGSVTTIEVEATGAMTVGGGVPTIPLIEWRWKAELPQSLPGMMTITMILRSERELRPWVRTVAVDD